MTIDRVRVLKIETPSTGGTQTDVYPTDINPNEDAVDARGVAVQNDTSFDDAVLISRDASDNMTFLDGVVGSAKTLTELLADDDQVKDNVATGDTFTVKEEYQHITYDEFIVRGEYVVRGEAVVIGDIGDNWNYKLMNEIFRKVKGGAAIVAMHHNRYWYPGGGELSLDAGVFIKAIEYGAERESILIGKPSPLYFRTALSLLGFSADDEFFMIGDDLENDVLAAKQIGGRGVLIYTGKTSFPLISNQNLKPDLEINSLTEMIDILEKVI